MRLGLAASLATAAVTLPVATHAQAAATGSISGRVQNAENGRYLSNARVTVVGTQVQGFTDEYGEFRLNNVPAGPQTIRVFYTGLSPKDITVEVRSGEVAASDISLGTDAETGDDTVKLETFVVSGQRERDAAALAVNEQRFAGNIKSVVSTDAFGDIAEGNIGEFLKYVPGLTIDYVAADARSAGLNGLDPSYTTVNFNGNRLASAASGGNSRTFEFESATISSASRIEVTKLPTPELSAEGLAGSINMVPKNAFEYARPKFTISAYLGMHDEELHLKKVGGIGNEKSFRTWPNFSFSYVNPISKNLGFTISGQSSNQFVDQHRTAYTWNWGQGNGTVTNPVLTNYTLQDGPKMSFREGLSGRLDWRLAPGHVLSVSAGTNYYETEFNNRNINWNTNTTTTALPSTANVPVTNPVNMSHSSTFTQSASGRGAVTHGQSFRNKITVTNNADLSYRFKGRLWEAESSLFWSKSRGWYPSKMFESLTVRMLNPDATVANNENVTVRIESDGSPFPRPDRLLSWGTAGTIIDPFDLNNYRVVSARTRPQIGIDTFRGVNLKVKRHLDFLPFYSALKVGGEVRIQTRDINAWQQDYNFNGINGNNRASLFAEKYYNGEDNGFGFSNIPWPSPYEAWNAYQADSSLFTSNASQEAGARRFYLQNSQYVEETVTSAFVQHEVKLFDNRLSAIYGVRYEKTEDNGQGVKVNGPSTTLADIEANWRQRGQAVEKNYDGYYPSINVNYTITENAILRAGFAKTFGRPNFSNIIPLTRVNDTINIENDGIGNVDPDTVLVRNTGLKPWRADNYDATLEYYLPNAGLVSVRGFVKDITGFNVSVNRPLTDADIAEFDLDNIDPAALARGMTIRTTVNSSVPARLAGYELTYRIAQLPLIPASFGRVGFYAAYTNQRTTGPGATNFTNFASELANARLNYSKGNFQAAAGMNYTARRRVQSLSGARYSNQTDFNEYIPRRIVIDVSADYKLSSRWSLFCNARNVFDEPNSIQEFYNPLSPDYSHVQRYEQYGVLINLGVKAEF